MRASGIALTFVAALVSSTAGAFAGGFAAGLTGNVAVGLLLLLPAALGAAHLLGRWITRRPDAPGPTELLLGCLAYVAVCAALGLGSRHGAGLIGLVVGLGIAWTLHRAASSARPRASVQTAG